MDKIYKKGHIFFKKKKKIKSWIAELLIISLLLPSLALAETLRLSPDSGSYDVGESFTVDLLVDSDEEMNTAGATLSFDPDLITVSDLSDGNSMFSMWPEEPDYSNSSGTISFGGGMPGDSFSGTDGNIISITFNAEKKGEAEVDFSDGEIIASGEDITGDLQDGSYSFEDSSSESESESEPDEPEPEPEPDEPEPEPEETESTDNDVAAPEISSETHSDPDKWYDDDSPQFSWDLDDDVEAVRVQASREEKDPTVEYDPPIDNKEVDELDDGVWHFLVQSKVDGSWGEVGSFTARIDTQSPEEFDLEVDDEGEATNPTPAIFFESEDSVSGIEEYEVRLNDEVYDSITPDELESPYRTSALEPGDYLLEVKAKDMAGNSVSDSTLFSVEPLELEVDDFPEKLEEDQEMRITGQTEPESKVKVYIEEGDEERVEEIEADSGGRFEYREVPESGSYRVSLQAEDERGATSLKTEGQVVDVSPDRLVMIVTIVLTALIIIGLIIIFLLKKQIEREREERKKEQEKDTIEVKREAYTVLEKRIKEQIEHLEEKVDLSRSESQLLDELRESLKVYNEARSEEDEEE